MAKRYTYGIKLDDKSYTSVLDETAIKCVDGVFGSDFQWWSPNLIKYVAQTAIRTYVKEMLKRDAVREMELEEEVVEEVWVQGEFEGFEEVEAESSAPNQLC